MFTLAITLVCVVDSFLRTVSQLAMVLFYSKTVNVVLDVELASETIKMRRLCTMCNVQILVVNVLKPADVFIFRS